MGHNNNGAYFEGGGIASIKSASGRRNGTFVYLPGHRHYDFLTSCCTYFYWLPSNLIGKRQITKNYFTGKFGEIIVYDRALSETEIETIEAYLGSKWGIARRRRSTTRYHWWSHGHIPFDENSGTARCIRKQPPRNLVNFDTNDSWTQGKIGVPWNWMVQMTGFQFLSRLV